MKLSNLKNNAFEVLNTNSLIALKGGGEGSPFNGGGSTTNSTNGDESDKRTKRPGTSSAAATILNVSNI